MNKKWLVGILATVCATTSALALTACSPKEPEQEHAHTYEATWSKDDKNHWYAANCGDTDEKLALGAHVWVSKVTEEATEEKAGTLTYTCAVCGATKTESIDKAGHTYSTDWTADETGHWHLSTCDHDSSEKEAHTFGDWETVIEATHTDKGVKVRSCTVCNYSEVDELSETGLHTYDVSKWRYDSKTHWLAADCGHNEKDSEAPHDFQYTSVGEAGHKMVCRNCLYTVFMSHNEEKGTEVVQERTCEQDGITISTCTCGYERTTTDYGGHSFGATLSGKNETHHWRAVTCEHSDAEGDELIAILESNLIGSKYEEHNFTKVMSVDKTKFFLTCNDCHYHKEEDIVGVADYGFKVYGSFDDRNSVPTGGYINLEGDEIHVINDNMMYFVFDEIQPAGATFESEINVNNPAKNTVKVYEVDEDGERIELSAMSTTVKAYIETFTRINIKVVDGNSHKLCVVTKNTEKEFTVIPDVSSASLTIKTYYDPTTGWEEKTSITSGVTAGQDIYLYVTFDGNPVDWTYEVTNGTAENISITAYTDNADIPVDETMDKTKIMVLNGAEAGVYRIKLYYMYSTVQFTFRPTAAA